MAQQLLMKRLEDEQKQFQSLQKGTPPTTLLVVWSRLILLRGDACWV